MKEIMVKRANGTGRPQHPQITIEAVFQGLRKKKIVRLWVKAYNVKNARCITGKLLRMERSDSKNDNDKVNMPLLQSPEPKVSYFDDLDFFKDFENEFPAIVYNDALTSKLDFLTEPTVSPQHIDEFNLKDETSLSECDEEEQNILNFNVLFPFNVIYPDDSKSDKDNDDDKIDIKQSSGDMSVKPLPDLINTDVGAYAHGSNKLLETSHDTSNKFFNTETLSRD
ncbi:hypothetical protein Tco_0593997 [Tanacetum coccineum]